MSPWPQRIVCLTEETAETLYRLGAQERIVGISGFTVRPPEARRRKPKVAAFTSVKHSRILELEPDLVLGFSDLQADIAAELIRAGVETYVFNQRSIAGIRAMVQRVAALVGLAEDGAALVATLDSHVNAVAERIPAVGERPVVYFEEWDDPPITGIQWVSELIAIAGGRDCFADRAACGHARDRILEDPGEVVRRAPHVIIGSWCGKRLRPERVAARPGWDHIPAVRNGHVYEIKSPDILQLGPAALTDGLDQLAHCIARAR
jgi:iron complex transport system substrate-binding protein